MQLVRFVAGVLLFLGIAIFSFGGGLLFLRRQQQYNDWMRESGRYNSPWFAGPRSKLDPYTYRLMLAGTVLFFASLAVVELTA